LPELIRQNKRVLTGILVRGGHSNQIPASARLRSAHAVRSEPCRAEAVSNVDVARRFHEARFGHIQIVKQPTEMVNLGYLHR
jgi:hypothetical protein